ncbi:MAG TPA: sugar ABC transporter permease [Actinomycetota bacterium]|jgi:multiple sugar transport system permease protein
MRPGRGAAGGRREEVLLAWALSAPVLAVLVLLVFYPLVRGLLMSFQSLDYSQGAGGGFVGWANVTSVLRNPATRDAALHTLGYVGCAVVLEVTGGLLIALALNKPFRGRGMVFSGLILPWALPSVVGGVLWSRTFNPDWGLLNSALVRLHLTHGYHAWFNNPVSAVVLIALVHVWNVLPLIALILLSGLQGIPPDVYAAASVDGAGAVQQFRRLTLPLLRPALAIALTAGTIAAAAIFDEIYVLNGVALSTRSVMMQVYLTTFRDLDFGRGTALANLLAAASAVCGLVFVRSLRRRTA